MEALVRRGKTFLLVSHSLSQIRDNCDRVIWLHHGQIVTDGPVVTKENAPGMMWMEGHYLI